MKTKVTLAITLFIGLLLPFGVAKAVGETPSVAYPFYNGEAFTVQAPSGLGTEPYEYLGILVSRYLPTTVNSTNAALYTQVYTHSDGKTEWFIPKSEMVAGEYVMPFNATAEYHKRLFSLVTTHQTYKVEAKHVFRLPDGRDIVGNTQNLFYKLDVTNPAGVLTQNPTTFTNGNVVITAVGSDGVGFGMKQIKKPDGTFTAGANTTYTVSANGTYIFVFEDMAGNVLSQNIVVSNVDKVAPTMVFNLVTRDWSATDISVGVTLSDTGVSGYKQYRHAWTTSTTKPVSGWSAWNTNAAPTLTHNRDGIWYLHIEAQDNAGNTGYAYSGSYKIDNSAPTLVMDFSEIIDEKIYSYIGTNKVNFAGTVSENNGDSKVQVYYRVVDEVNRNPVMAGDVLLFEQNTNVSNEGFSGVFRIDPKMKNGMYELSVYAKNHLGLTTTEIITFEVANPTSKPSVNISIHPQPTGKWVNGSIDAYVTDSGDFDLIAGATKKYEVTSNATYPVGFTETLPTDRKITMNQVGVNYLHVQYVLEDGTTLSSTAGPYLIDTSPVGDFNVTLKNPSGVEVTDWVNQNLTLVISDPSANSISGDIKQYRIENYHTEWQNYTDGTVISVEGNNRVFARIITKAGMVSEQKFARAMIDKTSPVVNKVSLGITNTGTYDVTIDATDSSSGIKHVKTNTGSTLNRMSNRYHVNDLGSKPVSVTIEDRAGNVVPNITFANEPIVEFQSPYNFAANVYRDDVHVSITGDLKVDYKLGNRLMNCTATPCTLSLLQNGLFTAINGDAMKQTSKEYQIINIDKSKLKLLLNAERSVTNPNDITFAWSYDIVGGKLECTEGGVKKTYTVSGKNKPHTGQNFLYDCYLEANYGGEILKSNRVILYPNAAFTVIGKQDINETEIKTNIYIEESKVGTSYIINAKSDNFKFDKIPLPENDITKN